MRMHVMKRSLRTTLWTGVLIALLPALVLLGATHLPGLGPIGVAEAARTEKDVSGVINLNTADEAQLCLLPGVGPTRARAIVAYRAKHKFTRPEELRRVKGFGAKTLAKLRKYLAVSGETTLRSSQAPAPSPFSSHTGAAPAPTTPR